MGKDKERKSLEEQGTCPENVELPDEELDTVAGGIRRSLPQICEICGYPGPFHSESCPHGGRGLNGR